MTSDVIVVGGGAAGLTAAAYAARAGRSVALFERQARLGGLVQSVERDGFVFDMGLRAVENAGIVLPMLEELGLHLDHVPSAVSVGIEDRVIRIDSQASLADYRDLLLRFYPDSAAGIDRIMGLIEGIMKDMDVLYGIDNPLFKDVLRDRAYLFGTLLPWMFRFVATIGRINRMAGPVEALLDELTDDRVAQEHHRPALLQGDPRLLRDELLQRLPRLPLPARGHGGPDGVVGGVRPGARCGGADRAANRQRRSGGADGHRHGRRRHGLPDPDLVRRPQDALPRRRHRGPRTTRAWLGRSPRGAPSWRRAPAATRCCRSSCRSTNLRTPSGPCPKDTSSTRPTPAGWGTCTRRAWRQLLARYAERAVARGAREGVPGHVVRPHDVRDLDPRPQGPYPGARQGRPG